MPTSCTFLYAHFVWATWDRAAMITPEVERVVYADIAAECREARCQLLAIGGTEDHVHVVVRLHATVSAAFLAKQMKGVSSHLVGHEVMEPGRSFRWQGSYGAFSVSPGALRRVCDYVERQKEHHAAGTTVADWERCSE